MSEWIAGQVSLSDYKNDSNTVYCYFSSNLNSWS